MMNQHPKNQNQSVHGNSNSTAQGDNNLINQGNGNYGVKGNKNQVVQGYNNRIITITSSLFFIIVIALIGLGHGVNYVETKIIEHSKALKKEEECQKIMEVAREVQAGFSLVKKDQASLIEIYDSFGQYAVERDRELRKIGDSIINERDLLIKIKISIENRKKYWLLLTKSDINSLNQDIRDYERRSKDLITAVEIFEEKGRKFTSEIEEIHKLSEKLLHKLHKFYDHYRGEMESIQITDEKLQSFRDQFADSFHKNSVAAQKQLAHSRSGDHKSSLQIAADNLLNYQAGIDSDFNVYCGLKNPGEI